MSEELKCEAVEVVGALINDPVYAGGITRDVKHAEKWGSRHEPLMTVDQNQRLMAAKDAEIERLKSAAPVVSDVVHHAFSRDRDIGWNAPAAEQALRALFEEWLKRSQFTRPNSPWDIWKACAKALESQQAASDSDFRKALHAQSEFKLTADRCSAAEWGWNARGAMAASVGGEREACAEWIEQGYGFPASQLCLLNGKDLERAFSGGWQASAALSPAGGGVVMPTSAELQALSQECEKMKGGIGLHYLNYAREVLRRWGSKPQANSQDEI